MLLVLFATGPAVVATAANRVTEALLVATASGKGAAKAARTLARRAVDAQVTPLVLLSRMRPAAAVLEAVRSATDSPATAELEKLVHLHLGDHPARWRTLRGRLKSFPGTVIELLELAATPASGTAWPDRADLPDLAKGTSVTGVRAAFLALLDAAPTATQLDLLSHVDDRTVHDLLVYGRWRSGWLDHIVAHGSTAARLSLAARTTLSAEGIEQLARLDDPAVNGLLFHRTCATPEQRTQLLSGRPFGLDRSTPVPLDPQLRQRLFARTGGWSGRDAVDCPDRQLQRHILRHVRLRGQTPQLRLLLNLWERYGPQEVADLIDADLNPVGYTRNPFQPGAKRVIKKLLKMPDHDAALTELREEVTREESPAAQIEMLRKDRTDHMNLFRESHHWHWAELLADHRREPFPEVIVGMLARARGCPAQLREEGRRALFSWQSGVEATLVSQGKSIEEVLRTTAIGKDVWEDEWIGRALAAQRVTWEQLLEYGHPARAVLGRLSRADSTAEQGYAALSGLLAECLDRSCDGWVLALRMLPDFDGPVGELLRTAAAATS